MLIVKGLKEEFGSEVALSFRGRNLNAKK